VAPVITEALENSFHAGLWLQYGLFVPQELKSALEAKKVPFVEDQCLGVEYALRH